MRYSQKRAHAACVLIAIAINLFSFQFSFGQSPGGVSTNLKWWLKADAQVLNASSSTPSTGEDVAQWKDQSSAANNAFSASGHEPTYQPGVINGYPVLRFTGIDYLDATNTPGISGSSLHYFAVFKQTDYWISDPDDQLGSYIIDRNASSNATPMASLKIGLSGSSITKYIFQERVDGGSTINYVASTASPVLGSASTFVIASFARDAGSLSGGINGAQSTGTGSSATLTPQRIRVGCHSTQTTDGKGGLIGDLAEVAVYSNQLTSTERQQVESYLAIKYGITLDQTTPTNYLSSSGTVIYPAASSHDSYDKDIAGIGSDSNSSLSQTSSQSQNSGSVLKVSNPSSLNNGDYLIWGHNSTTLGSSENAPSPYNGRILRVWRAAETGDVGTVTVSFDLTGMTGLSGLDLSQSSDFALLIDSDGDFSNATIHTTGRTISGNIVTFTGVSINNDDYFTLATNQAGLRWWMKADAGVINGSSLPAATNDAVAQWNDQSTLSNNATQATSGNRPVYQSNVINGNPVLRFSGNQFLDATRAPGISSSFSFFTVFKQNSFTAGSTSAGDGTYIVSRTVLNTPVASLKIVNTDKYGFLKTDNTANAKATISAESANTTSFVIVDYFRDVSSLSLSLGVNGTQTLLSDVNNGLTADPVRIGRHASTNTGLNGDFAELIVYNKSLTSTERRKILSYLAVKYGITLDQTSPTDYLSGSGVTVYPISTTHAGYNKDIAGIGKDNITSLNQTSGQSQNSGNMVKVSGPSSLDDNDFLIWAHDGGSVTTMETSDVNPIITGRLSRVWKVAETGEAGTVDIEIDLTNMPDPKDQDYLRLLIDRDGDGFQDNDGSILSGTLNGQLFTVNDVDFQNGDRFTVGVSNVLPITLLDFTVRSAGTVAVYANWITAHESNNHYFTLERSSDGVDFKEALRIPGAGNSNERKHYEAVDNAPYSGRSYYRLKQTDFDGTSTYSDVKTVKLVLELSLFPNPNDGDEFRISVDVKRSNHVQIDILNAAGLVIHSETQPATREGMQNFVIYPHTHLRSGLYYLKVKCDGEETGFKFIVR